MHFGKIVYIKTDLNPTQTQTWT